MKERDDAVSVASVSESNVTVGGPTVEETLIEPLRCGGRIEGSYSEGQVEEDGGEIMVEVVGSDVFVDGVRGQGGGGGLSGESSGEGLGKDGLERGMTSFDGDDGVLADLASGEVDALGTQVWDDRTGIGVESLQEVAGSSAKQNRDVVVEEAAVIVNEEALERGKGLVGGGSDFSGVSSSDKASVLDDEALHSKVETGMREYSVNARSSCEHTEVVIVEKADMVICDEGLERGLVEKDVERVMEPVNCVGASLDDLTSQRVHGLDGEVRNPEIESTVVCSSSMQESSSIQTHVVTGEEVVQVHEGLNHKDEVRGTDFEDVNLPCSEIDKKSAIEVSKDPAICVNSDFLDQHVEVAVGGEFGVVNKEEILHSKVEVMETDVFDGTLNCSVGDKQMKVETVGESTESHHDLCADSISVPEPTKTVVGGEMSAGNEKCTSNLDVKSPKNLGLDGVERDFGEVGIVCADSGCSIEQTQVAASYLGAIGGKISSPNAEAQVAGEGEVLNTKNRVVGAFVESLDYAEDQKLEVKTVGGDSRSDIDVCKLESSSEQTQAVNGNEVTVLYGSVSNPEVEVPTNADMDVVCFPEGDQNTINETSGNAGKDSVTCADSKSSYEQACVVERGNIEVASGVKDELPGTSVSDGSFSGKDQHLKVENIDGSSVNNVGHGELESSGELIQIAARGGIEAINNEEVPKIEGEAEKEDGETVFAPSNGNLCLPAAYQILEAVTVLGCAEKEGLEQADPGTSIKGENAAVVEESYGEKTEIGMQVESSAIDRQGNLEVPAICALDGNISIVERDEELKVETEQMSTEGDDAVGKDPSVGVDSPPVGDCGTTILRTSSDSIEENMPLQDEKQETVAQPATTLTCEADGDPSINPLFVDEISDQGASGLEVSDAVEISAKCQAAVSCASFNNEGDTVSSCVSDFISSLPDANQNLEVHLVSNDISLLDGDQTMAPCVSDFVTSKEVVNEPIEAKDQSHEVDKDRIICDHVSEGKDSKSNDGSIVCSLVVDLDTCLNKDERWKSQGVVVEENISLSDKSCCLGDDIQGTGGNVGLHSLEYLDGNATGDLCWAAANVEQDIEVEEQYTDSGQVELHTGQGMEIGKEATDTEQPKSDEENISQEASLKHRSFIGVHQGSHLLPIENEGEFSVSDLVWGKVRSHPWWPGQIFDPADASEKAMKYHKKDCFLVAYFGDRTFAWNEASLLKPFRLHFSQIEKQSSSEAFHTAVSCALEEVSRRVELGLACSCIPKDACERIESQIVENTGIRQESSRRYGVDNSTEVSSFKPDNLVEYMRALAQSPSDGADHLELVIAKAQLLAFSRLKGYYQLPEFQVCGGLMENDADSSQLSEALEQATLIDRDNEQIFLGKGKSRIENSSSHKRKHNLKDSAYPRKKERNLSDLMGDMAYSPDAEDGSDGKAMNKPVLTASGKKRKPVDSATDGSLVQDKRISIYAAKVSTTTSPFPKPSFKVGECIRRVASQLTGSPSILKGSGTDKAVGLDGLSHENSQKGRINFPTEYPSLDEMLSQLHLAARDPMKGYSFFNTIISFFSGFRNSIILGHFSGRQNSSGGKVGGGRKKNASQAIIGSPEEFEFDDVNDSYWTDMIIQNNSEEEQSGNNGNREGEYQLVAFEPDETHKPSRRSHSRKRFSNGNRELAVQDPEGYIDERNRELFPGELILNFSEGDSVPSEMNLNKMFRRFGPLKESETEVDCETCRARVVFKRFSDAEVAFSSAEKFNIFGSMLVNYQLSYSPSNSFRTLPLATSLGQDDAT